MPQDPNQSSLERSTERAGGLLIWLLVLGAFVLVGMQHWDGRWIQDDAYISFRYARSLAQGQGLVFNSGEYTEGYSNFLWVAIASIPIYFGIEDPLGWMHVLSLLAWVGSYVGAALLVRRTAPAYRTLVALLPAGLLFNYPFNMWFFSGMETGLVMLLYALVLLTLLTARSDSRRSLGLVSGTACLTLMTRLDSFFYLTGIYVAAICWEFWKTKNVARTRDYTLKLVLPGATLFIGYTCWRLYYFGDLFPNTYYSKLAYFAFYSRGWEYLRTYLRVDYYMWALPCVIAGFAASRSTTIRRFLFVAILGSLWHLAYVFRLGGDFMEWRFIVPVLIPMYLGVGLSIVVLLTELFGCARQAWSGFAELALVSAGGLMILLFLAWQRIGMEERSTTTLSTGQESIALLARYSRYPFCWREFGMMLAKFMPEETRLATPAAGMIPYFSKLYTIDTYGLTSQEIARKKATMAGAEKERAGHQFEERDLAFFEEHKIDLYLNWPGIEPAPYRRRYLTQYLPPGVHLVYFRRPGNLWLDGALLPSAPDKSYKSLRLSNEVALDDSPSIPYLAEFADNPTLPVQDPRCAHHFSES